MGKFMQAMAKNLTAVVLAVVAAAVVGPETTESFLEQFKDQDQADPLDFVASARFSPTSCLPTVGQRRRTIALI